MAENYSFFNSKEGDRKYNARNWADYFFPLFKSGVFNGNLQVVENGGMSVKIKDGYAWIDGYLYHLTGGLVLDLETASGNMNRTDNIVIRLDLTNRWVKGFVVEGAYYQKDAVAPEPTITSTVHEIVIARVNIQSGTTRITQDMIEDTRMDNNLCGWVTGTVEEIDYSQIYAQFTAYQKKKVEEIDKWQEVEEAAFMAWILAFKSENTTQMKKLIDDITDMKETAETEYSDWFYGSTNSWEDEFYTWFRNLKEQLTDDAAIHLQHQIGNLSELDTDTKESLTAAINEMNNTCEDLTKTDNESIQRDEQNRLYVPALSRTFRAEIVIINNSAARIVLPLDISEHQEGDIFFCDITQATAGASYVCLPTDFAIMKDGVQSKAYIYTTNYITGYNNPKGTLAKVPYLSSNGNTYYDSRKGFTIVVLRNVRSGPVTFLDLLNGYTDSAGAIDGLTSLSESLVTGGLIYQTFYNALLHHAMFYAESIGTSGVTIQIPHTGAYLLVVTAKNASTKAVYGATARLLVTPDTASSTANVTSLALGTTSNTGFTITLGNFLITVKASSATYLVNAYVYTIGH